MYLFQFECCGIEGPNDYATSLWKLQYLGGPDATVSKTCCLLLNMKEEQAYINPRPINDTLCQSDEIRYNALYRHQRVNYTQFYTSRPSTISLTNTGLSRKTGTLHSERKLGLHSHGMWISRSCGKFSLYSG